jgi:hypothetical protein
MKGAIGAAVGGIMCVEVKDGVVGPEFSSIPTSGSQSRFVRFASNRRNTSEVMTTGALKLGYTQDGGVFVELAGSAVAPQASPSYPLHNGAFHHIGFTVVEGGVMRIYVDGMLTHELLSSAQSGDPRGSVISLGLSFEGYLDDGTFFTRALTGAEVRLQAVMAVGGIAGVETGPTFSTRVSSRIMPCVAEVSGTVAIEHGVAGRYVELVQNTSIFVPDGNSTRLGVGSVFVTADNKTRLRWTSGPSRFERGCKDGWVIEETYEETRVEFFNCSDAPSGAIEYIRRAYGYSSELTDVEPRFVCGWAQGEGLCIDPVVAGLCSFSCHPFQTTKVAGHLVKFQDLTMGLRGQSCLGDNDYAVNRYLNETDAYRCTGNQVMRNCLIGDIIKSLCKETCAGVVPATTTTTTTTTDGSDELYLRGSIAQPFGPPYAGSSYVPLRLLEGPRQLAAITYTPHTASTWYLKFRTWAGPDFADECNSSMVSPAPDLSLLRGVDSFYWITVPLDASAVLQHTCLLSMCPAGTVCVTEDDRFVDELTAAIEVMGVSLIGTDFTYISKSIADIGEASFDAGRMSGPKFAPKVIVSKDRTIAFIGPLFGGTRAFESTAPQDWFAASGGAFRAVLGPMRVVDIKLTLPGPEGEAVETDADLVLTLVKNTLPTKAFYKPHFGDIVRLEAFGADGALTVVDVELKLYIPLHNLPIAFCVSPDGTETMVGVEQGGKVSGLEQRYTKIKVLGSLLPCELHFTEDIKECDASPCHTQAQCVEQVGGAAQCLCMAPFVATAQNGFAPDGCELTTGIIPDQYYENKYIQIDIRPLDHTKRGWIVEQINSHKYHDCGQLSRQPFYDTYNVTGSKPYPPSGSENFEVENAVLTNGEYRTECQACNGLNTTLDEPDGMYVNDGVIWTSEPYIRFFLQYSQLESLCISIKQKSDPPPALKLWRSERYCEGPSPGACQTATPGNGVAKPFTTQGWVGAGASLVNIPFYCGKEGVKLLGEALLTSGGPIYMRGQLLNVPSSCHCESLCMELSGEGCVGWTFYKRLKHCSLLSSVFGPGEGWHGAAEIPLEEAASGRLPLSIFDAAATVTPTELTVVARGTALDPELRLKLVPKGARCLAKPAPQVVDDCAPAPDSLRTVRGEDVTVTSYPFCSLRPTIERELGAVATATWRVPIQLSVAAELKACVCKVYSECADPTQWQVLEAPVILPQAEALWNTSETTVVRETSIFGAKPLELEVTGSHTALRLVKATLGCGVESDGTAKVVLVSVEGGTAKYSVELAWTDADFAAYSTEEKELLVCGQLTTGGEFLPLSSTAGVKSITVLALDSDVTTPYGPYVGQTASVTAGVERVVKIKGRMLPYELVQDKLALSTDPTCASVAEEFSAASSGSDLDTIGFTVETGLPAGSYSMCYCHGSEGSGTENLTTSSYATLRYVSYDEDLTSTTYLSAPADLGSYAEHLCHAKCATGCVGCGCEGYISAVHNHKTAVLCTATDVCLAACTALGPSVCAGFETSSTTPGQCRLIAASQVNAVNDTRPTSQSWHAFVRAPATCSYMPVGTMTVTRRFKVGVDYVVAPKQMQGIEAVRPASFAGGLSAKDRILVAPCGSPCPPADAVQLDGGWWQLAARNAKFLDPPNGDPEPVLKPRSFVDVHITPMRYCPGNLDRASLMGSTADKINAARCYTKCAEGCVGPTCFCDGYMSGYDGPDSEALCGDQETCEDLCALTGCGSIDMHKTLPRCFLNTDSCVAKSGIPVDPFSTPLDETAVDPNYNLLTEKVDECGEAMLRDDRREFTDEEKCGFFAPQGCCFAAGRCAKCAPGPLPGQLEVLEFGPFSVPAGTYQVCACDASLGGAVGSPCRKYEDFTIDLGTLHSSGVQCLLGDTRMARATCTSQSLGGFRCEE